jgi:hypothetical protein
MAENTSDVRLQVSDRVVTGVGGNFTVTPYPERLLALAHDLIKGKEFTVAVVLAHMACEIRTEQTLSRSWRWRTYSLDNNKVRTRYNNLTGDTIENQPFWTAFTSAATLRHQAVHRGRIATEAEAEAAVKAAGDLVAYLNEKTPRIT